MTKLAVLSIFAETKGFATPDYVRQKLQPNPDRRSFYSYLARLQKQGLLERAPNARRGRLSYRITRRGQERIVYLKRNKRLTPSR
jgi:DNA-binding PadR family transcriptional regulator